MTQKERQARSREEIYQAALEEFGTRGYDPVNMERICSQHGISKGMMYHYYSSKDELFLLCVERTFADLRAYIEQDWKAPGSTAPLESIQSYFMIRECFFQRHPRQKVVFESAMLRPPKHLAEQIRALHAPLREINRRFLEQLAAHAALRPGVDQKKVIRYLESVEHVFRNMLLYDQDASAAQDLHTMLAAAGELLDMVLFGVLQQPDMPTKPSPQ